MKLASTVTIKGQATIPVEVRKALDLKTGDTVTFEMRDHKVTISKAKPFDRSYHYALSQTLSEWNSPEDDEAYNG